jgi:hypothetical protein
MPNSIARSIVVIPLLSRIVGLIHALARALLELSYQVELLSTMARLVHLHHLQQSPETEDDVLMSISLGCLSRTLAISE